MINQERDLVTGIGWFIMFVIYATIFYLTFQMGVKQGAKELHQGKWICETALEETICKEVAGND